MHIEPSRDQSPPRTIRHELSLRSIGALLAVAAGSWLLIKLWPVLLLLLIALMLAATIHPMVAWLEQRRIKRGFGLAFVGLALAGAVAGLGALVIPALSEQIGNLISHAPAIQAQVAGYLTKVPGLAGTAEAVRTAQPERFLGPLASYAVAAGGAAVEFVILSVTTLVIAFYLLSDHERVKGFAFAFIPRRFHLRTARVLIDMEAVVGGYIRGQALTSLLIGIVVAAVLWIAGAPSPLALALLAAFADLIPFVGGFLVVIPVVLATLTRGALPATLAAGAIILYLQVESHVLIPWIYGRVLRLSPLAVIVALLIGGQLMGIVGALLALPIAAGFRVILEQWRIDLPGEEPIPVAQQLSDAAAEAALAAQTAGASAKEAATLATTMAEQTHEPATAE